MSSDPTPAEIEAGADALRRHVGVALPYPTATVVLRAVLPDHDAQVRADERRRVADRLMASTPAMPPPGYTGQTEAAREIEIWKRAADVASQSLADAEEVAIARAHTTEGGTDA